MADEQPTEVNYDRRHGMPEADIQRIQETLCRYVLRIGSIALAIMVTINLGVGAVFWGWTSDIRKAMTAQQIRGAATDQQVAALDSDAVRRAQLLAVAEKVQELEGATSALRGNVHEIKRQQDRLDSMIGLLSGSVTSLTSRVTEEAKGRETLMKEMQALGIRLDKR